jgi:hypothetical protein
MKVSTLTEKNKIQEFFKNEILDEFIFNSPKTKNKKAFFTGGLPGAGKTTTIDFEKKYPEYNPVRIDIDEIRAFLPYWDDVKHLKEGSQISQKDAGLLASLLRNYCIENGYDSIR